MRNLTLQLLQENRGLTDLQENKGINRLYIKQKGLVGVRTRTLFQVGDAHLHECADLSGAVIQLRFFKSSCSLNGCCGGFTKP